MASGVAVADGSATALPVTTQVTQTIEVVDATAVAFDVTPVALAAVSQAAAEAQVPQTLATNVSIKPARADATAVAFDVHVLRVVLETQRLRGHLDNIHLTGTVPAEEVNRLIGVVPKPATLTGHLRKVE
jgi:hypothetical protein